MRNVRRLGWWLFLALDGALLALFAGAYAARYLQPGFFWQLELAAVGLPYLSLAVAAAGLAAILGRRWALAGLHAAALALALARFSPHERLLREASTDTTGVLTVMTFNAPEKAAGYTLAEQRRSMRRLIEAEQPDLAAFQDAHAFLEAGALRGRPHLRVLTDSLGYHAAPPGRIRGAYTEQPVFGRIPLGPLDEIELPVSPDDPSRLRFVRVPFEWQGRPAVLYNLHLRSFGRAKPWREDTLKLFSRDFWRPYLGRYERAFRFRAQEAAFIVERIRAERVPVIVCGDFNSTPHNSAYYRLKHDLGLQDAFQEAGRGWGSTYHARYPLVRIDYVLVGREWEALGAHVPEEHPSDHRALVARLRWKES